MSVFNKRPMPNVNGLPAAEAVKRLYDYLNTFTEEIRYAISNIEPDDNFTDESYIQYKALIRLVEGFSDKDEPFTGVIPEGASVRVKNGIIVGIEEV